MNYKPTILIDNLKTVKTFNHRKKGDLKLLNLSKSNPISGKAEIATLKQRLQLMEEINAEMKNRLGEQSEKLAEVVATNSKFLSIIAHDLRSPFTSIISVLELLRESYFEYNLKDVEKYIRMATKSANGTLTLLDNLLSWTFAQNKAAFSNPVKINLFKLVQEEIENSADTAMHKLIQINQSIPENLNIFADLLMVKTIFRNLINNAIKFSYIGGEITVYASEGVPFVEITIEDHGIGISGKAQRELFENNALYSTRGTNNEFGTGLGLVICKEFIEKHGGNILIDSLQGKGTKIKFTLPC